MHHHLLGAFLHGGRQVRVYLADLLIRPPGAAGRLDEWLALLLIRITKTTTGQTWNHLRAELQRIHLSTFTGSHDTFTYRTQLTASHKLILKALDLPEPPLVVSAAPATP